MKSRLKELISRLERERGERIWQKDIATATGLSTKTISRWMSPEPFGQLDPVAITKLCRFLDVEMGDLLYIDELEPS
ncbi:helix-turn-helix domain-containing protein [Phototrophicus methaneseepsis]|uniref:Helix-turn-helix domain-containing protein n=1 Tax=Phototrophicus methaneseepsis TaxID=2710758 RepID=A0A7S8E887_9CHLR|nr:helix-turn-helix domain-containing protein [Phototrophicus methaneseepsis]QPC82088.1 helix-turn-helix domain-containing protein [Phototrophicus methaneseepsis]